VATRKKASTKGKKKIHRVMKEKKEGKLKSSSGRKVTSRKQAVAIALNEAREAGAKIPKKSKKASGKKASGKKASSKKTSSKKTSSRKKSK
jgi:hypothetical protein